MADVVALGLAFAAVELVFGLGAHPGDRYDDFQELGFFLAMVPFWVVVAKLYGLYDRDEDRADNTTADDLIGVVHVLTIGAWLVFAVSSASGSPIPGVGKCPVLGARNLFVTLARAAARTFCRRLPPISRTPSS